MQLTPRLLNKNDSRLSQEMLSLFMQFCEELTHQVSVFKYHVEPYNAKGIEKFISLETEQQIETLNSLKKAVQQLSEAAKSEGDLTKDNRKHAWWTLRSLGYVPPEDLFDKILPTDIIEIYDASCIQMFRSLDLFKHISYSFSEIFTFTWMELFERDEFVGQRMLKQAEGVLSGKYKGILKTDLPSHVAEEKFSQSRHWIRMQHKMLCPLHRVDGSMAGFVTVFSLVDYGKKA